MILGAVAGPPAVGVPVSGAHRYWRIYSYRNSGDASYSGLSEIEMRTTPSGADECSGGTATSAGSIQAGSAASCFDNNTGTGIQWTGTGADKWVQYDFGAGNEKEIVEISILPKHDDANRTFGDFGIYSSDDDADWNLEWVGRYTAWVIGTPIVFTKPSAVDHRYWRLRADALVSANTMSCAEMQMRASVSGADETGSGTASARTTYSGTYSADKAFDNNSSTLWSGNGGMDNAEWLAYDFGSGVVKNIVEISFTARNDVSYTQSPTAGWIESSPDARSWLPRWTFSGISWTQGATRVFSA